MSTAEPDPTGPSTDPRGTNGDRTRSARSARRRRRGFWWRWTRRLAITAIALRILLWLFLLPLVDFGAGFAGLDVSWRQASLSLLGLSLHVEDLVVRDTARPQAPPLFTAQDLLCDLSLQQLATGRVALVDAVLAGARVKVERTADGDLLLPAAWRNPAAGTEPGNASPAADAEPLTFDLPVQIASARVHDLQFTLIDHATEPPTSQQATLDLDVANFGFPGHRGVARLRLDVPPRVDEITVTLHAETSRDRANVSYQVAVRGLRPHAFDLSPALLDSIDHAHVVDLRSSGDLNLGVLADAPTVPAVDGRIEVRAALDGIDRSLLVATFGPTASEAGRLTLPCAIELATDGVVRSLRLSDAHLAFTDEHTAMRASLTADGLTCRRLRPLLRACGIALPADGIDLTARLAGGFGDELQFALEDLRVGDGARELFTLDRVVARDVRDTAGILSVGAVEIVGPEVPVAIDADGNTTLAGLRLLPPDLDEAGDDPPPAEPATADAFTLPRVSIGSFDWSGARLTLQHERIPQTSVALTDVHLHLDQIAIGVDAPPGRASLSFAVPDAIGTCSAELTWSPRKDGFGAEVACRMEQVTLAALRGWLAPLGIEPDLHNGTVQFGARADVNITADGLDCAAELADLRLTDGERRWFALRRVRGEGLRLGRNGFDAGAWTVQEPFARVHRDKAGHLHVGGLVFAAPATTEAAPVRPMPSGPAVRRRLPNTDAPPFRHGPLSVREGSIAWTDAAHERALAIGLDAELGANDGSGSRIPVALGLRLDRAVQELRANAELQLTPDRSVVTGTLSARGVQGEHLQPLLPAGVRCTLVDGELRAAFAADIASGTAMAIDASLHGLSLRDRAAEVLAIDEVLAKVPHLAQDEVHVEELRVLGARLAIARTPEALQLPGFALEAKAPPTAGPPEPAPTSPDGANTAPPAAWPRLRVDAFAAQLERLAWRDRTDGDAEPVTLRAELRLERPWRGDPQADEPEPLALALHANCAPFNAELVAAAELRPFAIAPSLDIDLGLDHCDTTALARVLPALSEQVRGEATGLSAQARLEARLDLKRRDPAVFDLTRPFGLELALTDFVLRDDATDTDYVRLAGLDARVRSFDPNGGDLLVRNLDIDGPVLRAHRDQAGLHIAGFVLKDTENAPAEPAPIEPAPIEPAHAEPPPSAPATAAEFAIERLRLLGLAVDYRDETTTPATHLRLADTDAELLRFTTRALHEPLPLSFSVAVRGDEVELDRRVVRSSLLSGVVQSGVDLVTGGSDQHERELRPLLDQLQATGTLSLFPQPKGRIDVGLDRLELPALRGLAAQSGVELADGLYDLRMRVDLRGYDGIDIDSEHVFTWLELSEPPDGPISTYLRLPAPLQTVLFLLRNADDQQRLPIRLHVPADGIRAGAIADLVAESLTRLIADAVGDAGNRALGMLTDPLFGGHAEVPAIAVEMPFAPGSELPADTELEALVAAARADDTLSIVLLHELSERDRERVAALANPVEAVVRRTVQQLAAERRDLERERPTLAADVVALYAAGKSQEAERCHRRLTRLDTELGELLATQAEALDQLGNTNPRAQARRTRAAARQLAEARLDAATGRLLQQFPELAPDRIERRPGRGVAITNRAASGRVVLGLRRRTVRAR